MSETNYEITVAQIRGILRLPRQASCSDIVARVRELKAIEDLSLAVHQHHKDKAAGGRTMTVVSPRDFKESIAIPL